MAISDVKEYTHLTEEEVGLLAFQGPVAREHPDTGVRGEGLEVHRGHVRKISGSPLASGQPAATP